MMKEPCKHCGKERNVNEMIVTDYGFFCKGCEEQALTLCRICGEWKDMSRCDKCGYDENDEEDAYENIKENPVGIRGFVDGIK